MSDTTNTNGCGCVNFVATVLLLWALWLGLPTPWGVVNIDILPPAIRIEPVDGAQ